MLNFLYNKNGYIDILKVIKKQNWGALENFEFEKKNVDRKISQEKKIPRYCQEETTFLQFLL